MREGDFENVELEQIRQPSNTTNYERVITMDLDKLAELLTYCCRYGGVPWDIDRFGMYYLDVAYDEAKKGVKKWLTTDTTTYQMYQMKCKR